MLKQLVFLLSLSLMFVLLSVFVGAVQAQSSDLPPLTEPGPYGVGIKILQLTDPIRENWTVETTVWFPADPSKGRQLTTNSPTRMGAVPDLSGAPYPLIIYSHGYTGLGADSQLAHTMELLAAQGYVVAAPQHHDTSPQQYELVNRPLDVMLVLNELSTITDPKLVGMIDTDNVGLLGYSLGGSTVLQMLGLLRDPANVAPWCAQHTDLTTWDCNAPPNVGHPDPDLITAYRAQLGLQTLPDGTWVPFGDERIHAAMVLAPSVTPLTTDDMIAGVTIPMMILQGNRDETVDYESNAVRLYNHLASADHYLVTSVGGLHMSYASIQEVPLHFAVAFFGDYLKVDVTYAPYLTAEGLPTFRGVTLAWGPYAGE